MASPESADASPAQGPVNNNNDQDLLQSMNKLSISTSSNSKTNGHMRSGSERQSSASPITKSPMKSPLNRLNSNGSAGGPRSPTPNLLRKSSTSSMRSATSAAPERAPSRRSSASPLVSKPSRSSLGIQREVYVEKKPIPPGILARDCLKKELDLLHTNATDRSAETVVILHDACYGHRFSRPRSSKGTLNTIVERPERIQAAVLGVGVAYVRLGERHCDGKHPPHPDLDPLTIPGIPFRIHKTDRTVSLASVAVTNVHGTKWMDELKVMCDSAETKLALNSNELRRPDTAKSSDSDKASEQLHQGDLYLCSESLNAFEGALGAVCEAVDQVFSTSPHKRAFVAVRPPGHHCSASQPSGFCWVNNVHVGIMHGILNHGLTHAAIIDFDLHHGDGSQAIAWQHNKRGLAKNAAAWKKTSIGYFSLHDINSYPCEWGDDEKVGNASLCIDNAHGQNMWNVHLQEWKSDIEFWKLYQSKYTILLEKARSYLRLQTDRYRAAGQEPKAAIFLSAGFDASEWEGAGMQRHKVNVPTSFYARLTRDVVKLSMEEGLGVDGRVISVLEGGYSDRALYSGVLSHLSGLAGTAPAASPRSRSSSELSDFTGPLSRRTTLNEGDLKAWKALEFPYDPNWWSQAELDRLDAGGALPSAAARKALVFQVGNYSSPTQASDAKLTEVAKVRRAVSGTPTSQRIVARPPTPPPPEVPWVDAAHALGRLLIPETRQVNSYRHDELNAEASKARRERHSSQNGIDDDAISVVSQRSTAGPAAPSRKSLRERKPVNYADDEDDSKWRRKTVGAPSVLAVEKANARGIPPPNGTKQPRSARRLSASSNLTITTQAPSEAASAVTRPDSVMSSVQSVRPESSMSVRTQTSTLNVKKARPTTTRKDSGRAPRAPRKTKPAAESTSTQSELSDKNLAALDKANLAVPHPTQMPGNPTHGDNMESLTTGMKKIKINVLTKEKKEERQRAEEEKRQAAQREVEAEKAAKAKPTTPSVSVFPPFEQDELALDFQPPESVANTKTQLQMEDPFVQDPVNGSGPSMDNHSRPSSIEVKPEPTLPSPPAVNTPTEPAPGSAPFDSSSPVPPTPQAAIEQGGFVPYQPEGPPAKPVPISGPVKILAPNTGTPAKPTNPPAKATSPPSKATNPPVKLSPVKGRSQQPVSPARKNTHGFTATGHIPFAPRQSQESQKK
ncbi:hypothetical protein F4780DRAFT_756299 [Xylariomycetidae sp. FL0641]|nr:hypothetical protein F4780DRAFT_756299 [Xylariomycetidae sp. FL0641]